MTLHSEEPTPFRGVVPSEVDKVKAKSCPRCKMANLGPIGYEVGCVICGHRDYTTIPQEQKDLKRRLLPRGARRAPTKAGRPRNRKRKR